jgi:hypothetical protein
MKWITSASSGRIRRIICSTSEAREKFSPEPCPFVVFKHLAVSGINPVAFFLADLHQFLEI